MRKRYANYVNDGLNDFYKKRIEEEYFKGYVCLMKIRDVKKPLTIDDDGFTACVLDSNYKWLGIYPDNENYAITVIFNDKGNLIEWYFDIVKMNGIENGIPYIDDLYLDLVVTPKGRFILVDEDELKEALENKDITKNDYDMAYQVTQKLKSKYENNLEELIDLTNKLYKLFTIEKR